MSDYVPQIGDRVRVTFEGEVTSCFGGRVALVKSDDNKGFWGNGSIASKGVSIERVIA